MVLIMPYNAQLLQSDKEYCLEQLKYMRQEIPGYKKFLDIFLNIFYFILFNIFYYLLICKYDLVDTTVLILTYGSKDTWVNIVENSTSDLFAIGLGDNRDALAPLDKLISRIKRSKI